MSRQDQPRESRRQKTPAKGWMPFAAVSCGIVIVLTLAAGAFIVLRLSAASNSGFLGSLADLLDAATTERGTMAQLKDDLASKYPAEGVSVRAGTRTILGSDTATLSLDVEFVNPGFVALAQGPQTADVAREIAVYVASTYPNIERYQAISITLLFKSGPLGTSAAYRFDVSELVRSLGTPQSGGAWSPDRVS